jgi:hypothetical protein
LSSSIKESVAALRCVFAGTACSVTDEAGLSAIVRMRLQAAAVEFDSEVCLDGDRRNRIDFVVGRVGLELKIDGSPSSVLRQLDRYAAADELDAVVLITTRRSHLRGLPDELRGKAIAAFHVGAF